MNGAELFEETQSFSPWIYGLVFVVFAILAAVATMRQTTRVTPAMQAGLTDHVWSLSELLTAALETPADTPPLVPPPPTYPLLSAAQAKGTRVGTGSRGRAHGLRIIQGRRK